MWAGVEHSPFFVAEFDMLVRFCGTEPDALGSTFVAGGENQIGEWFDAAGLGETTIELVEELVPLPAVVDYVPQHLRALPWSGGFFELSDGARADAIAWMGERLTDYEADGGIEVPFRSYLAMTVV